MGACDVDIRCESNTGSRQDFAFDQSAHAPARTISEAIDAQSPIVYPSYHWHTGAILGYGSFP